MTDQQTVIYLATNHCQSKLILILTRKKESKNERILRVDNDSAILNRVLEFPVTLVWTETHNFSYVFNVH